MPITPHHACIEPPGETVICRFIDLCKFRDLFASEELYFRRTDLFKDPWEALPSDEYARAALGLKRCVLNDEIKLNNDQAFNRQYSENYYISCWQIFEGETIHMWDTYARKEGVVIFSRFDLLKFQLSPMFDPILIGTVKYSEATTTGYNLIQFLFTKRACFDKEKELRILLECHDPMAGMNRHYGANNFPNRKPLDENPIHSWVHPCKRRRIDLKTLVTEIRLSPWAKPEETEEVELWVKNKNFSCPVKPSDITSSLTPTPDEFQKYGA